MLSDEEKKAIKILTNKRPSEQMLISGKMCVNVLINLIKKQSKEIEELKNGQIDFWISDKEIEERIRNKFVSKDKIKAKTIEIKNRPVKDEFITASQGKLDTIIEIESLLERK